MANAKFEAAIAAMHKVRDASGVDIEGKLYSRVKDRIELFRREWGDEYGIDSVVSYDAGFGRGAVVVACAKITKDGNILASGWAMEIVGSDTYTSHSPIEVAETSAIGRALACFGLHGGEYASDSEVQAKQNRRGASGGIGSMGHSLGGRTQGQANNGPTQEQRMVNNMPPQESSGLYMPEIDEAWTQPDVGQKNILMQIDGIPDVGLLGRYWGELKPFMRELAKGQPDMVAEIKAAFATANSKMGGR